MWCAPVSQPRAGFEPGTASQMNHRCKQPRRATPRHAAPPRPSLSHHDSWQIYLSVLAVELWNRVTLIKVELTTSWFKARPETPSAIHLLMGARLHFWGFSPFPVTSKARVVRGDSNQQPPCDLFSLLPVKVFFFFFFFVFFFFYHYFYYYYSDSFRGIPTWGRSMHNFFFICSMLILNAI